MGLLNLMAVGLLKLRSFWVMLCFSLWETKLEKRANSTTWSHRYQWFSKVCRAVSARTSSTVLKWWSLLINHFGDIDNFRTSGLNVLGSLNL